MIYPFSFGLGPPRNTEPAVLSLVKSSCSISVFVRSLGALTKKQMSQSSIGAKSCSGGIHASPNQVPAAMNQNRGINRPSQLKNPAVSPVSPVSPSRKGLCRVPGSRPARLRLRNVAPIDPFGREDVKGLCTKLLDPRSTLDMRST